VDCESCSTWDIHEDFWYCDGIAKLRRCITGFYRFSKLASGCTTSVTTWRCREMFWTSWRNFCCSMVLSIFSYSLEIEAESPCRLVRSSFTIVKQPIQFLYSSITHSRLYCDTLLFMLHIQAQAAHVLRRQLWAVTCRMVSKRKNSGWKISVGMESTGFCREMRSKRRQ
jgi:hypothetical protein